MIEVKSRQQVVYPAMLDIQDFVVTDVVPGGVHTLYRLDGLIMHLGSSATSGHCVCLQRLNSEKFLLRNDAQLAQEWSEQRALAQTADVVGLVYTRLHFRSACPTLYSQHLSAGMHTYIAARQSAACMHTSAHES